MSRKKIEAGEAYVGLGIRSKLKKGLAMATSRLRSFGAGARKIGGMVAGAGLAIGSGFGVATAVFAKFDDQMRAVRGVTQATDKDFAKLTETAKRLGRTTSFTAGEVAMLMTELGRAGFSPDQIDAMTESVLSLSKATGTEGAVSAGIMAATIRQFKLEADDASRVADALTVAANGSFNSVTSLGDALSYAGPVAADLGMSVEDTLAILGGLGSVGIQGSSAGNAIRRLATLVAAESDKMKRIFGVNSKDAAGNARPLVEVLGEINEATKGLGTADRAKKFNEAFGLLGITAASAISKSVDSIGKLRTKLDDAAGSAKKTADEMESGLGGSFRKLKSAAEGVAIAIGDALGGHIQTMIDYMTSAIGAVTEFIQNNKTLIVVAAGVAAAMVVVGTAIAGAGVAATVAAIAISSVLGLVGAIASPAGLVAIAIAAFVTQATLLVGLPLAAWFTIWINSSQEAGDLLRFFGAELGKLLSIAKDTFGGIFTAIKNGNWALAGKIALAGLKAAFYTGLESIQDNWHTWLGMLGTSLQKAFKAIVEYSKQALKFIIDRMRIAQEIAQKIASGDLVGAAAQSFSSLNAEFKASFNIDGVFDDIKGKAKEARKELADLIKQAKMLDASKGAMNDLAGLATSVGKWGQGVGDNFSKLFNKTGDPVSEGAKQVRESMAGATRASLDARSFARGGPGARSIEKKLLEKSIEAQDEREGQTTLLEEIRDKIGNNFG